MNESGSLSASWLVIAWAVLISSSYSLASIILLKLSHQAVKLSREASAHTAMGNCLVPHLEVPEELLMNSSRILNKSLRILKSSSRILKTSYFEQF